MLDGLLLPTFKYINELFMLDAGWLMDYYCQLFSTIMNCLCFMLDA